MAARSVGFVYVLANPSMPGRVKIGYTDGLSEDRARKLHTTGIPLPFEVKYRTLTSHTHAVERRAHELLANHRTNPQREYFDVTPTEAEAAVRQACLDAAGIEAWDTEECATMRAGDRVALTMRSGQRLVVLAYSLPADRWEPIDIWQAHSDGDLLHLMATDSAEHVAGMSTNDEDGVVDPLPYLDRAGDVPNWPINGRERLHPGDRLLWLDDTINPPVCSIALFEFSCYCQVVCRTKTPMLSIEGFPLVLNVVTEDATEAMVLVTRAALRMAPPRQLVYPRERIEGPQSRSEGPADPSYWLQQLRPERRKSRRSGPK